MYLTRIVGWPDKPGEWSPITIAGASEPTNVMLCCPVCKKGIHIEGAQHVQHAEKHVIIFHTDGTFSTVKPVRCPYGPCKWQALIDHGTYDETQS